MKILKILIISPKSRTIVNFRGDLIKEMVLKGHEVITIGPETGYEKEIQELGAKFILLEMKKNSTGFLHDLKYMINLMKIIKKEKPDIVFSYTIKPVVYGSIASKLAGVKKIYSMITGLGYVYTSKTLKSRIIKIIVSILYILGFSCATKVIFQNSDDLNEFIKARYVSKKKCTLVNGSGVNMDRFSRTELPKDISFLMISRAMRIKGIMEYLNAAKIVKSKYPKIQFKLLGAIEKMQDSLTYKDIQPYIDNGIIEYFGETKDVRPYIVNCSVYVLPSYREGTPRTVLEAMAIGRPIITTNAPGCRETVISGVNGYLVSIKDTNMLAEKMIWMIENQAKLPKMAEESFRMCSEKYDVKKVNEAIIRIMNLDELAVNYV